MRELRIRALGDSLLADGAERSTTSGCCLSRFRGRGFGSVGLVRSMTFSAMRRVVDFAIREEINLQINCALLLPQLPDARVLLRILRAWRRAHRSELTTLARHARPRTFFMILVTAISKSSCVTCTLRSRSANMPASVQQPLSSAPEEVDIRFEIFCRSMPRVRFIFLWRRSGTERLACPV